MNENELIDRLLVRANLGDIAIVDGGRAVLTAFHDGRPNEVLADVTDLCTVAAELGLIRRGRDRDKWSITWDAIHRLHRLDGDRFIDPSAAGADLIEWSAKR